MRDEQREASVRDHFDPDDDDAASDRVVRTVAALTDDDPVDLPPLYEVIDPEALDALVDDSAAEECEIAFEYAETEVYFSPGGDLHVTTADD